MNKKQFLAMALMIITSSAKAMDSKPQGDDAYSARQSKSQASTSVFRSEKQFLELSIQRLQQDWDERDEMAEFSKWESRFAKLKQADEKDQSSELQMRFQEYTHAVDKKDHGWAYQAAEKLGKAFKKNQASGQEVINLESLFSGQSKKRYKKICDLREQIVCLNPGDPNFNQKFHEIRQKALKALQRQALQGDSETEFEPRLQTLKKFVGNNNVKDIKINIKDIKINTVQDLGNSLNKMSVDDSNVSDSDDDHLLFRANFGMDMYTAFHKYHVTDIKENIRAYKAYMQFANRYHKLAILRKKIVDLAQSPDFRSDLLKLQAEVKEQQAKRKEKTQRIAQLEEDIQAQMQFVADSKAGKTGVKMQRFAECKLSVLTGRLLDTYKYRDYDSDRSDGEKDFSESVKENYFKIPNDLDDFVDQTICLSDSCKKIELWTPYELQQTYDYIHCIKKSRFYQGLQKSSDFCGYIRDLNNCLNEVETKIKGRLNPGGDGAKSTMDVGEAGVSNIGSGGDGQDFLIKQSIDQTSVTEKVSDEVESSQKKNPNASKDDQAD